MGAARIEIYRMQDRRDQFPGQMSSQMPLQVSTETTSTTATTSGSRIAVANVDAYARLHAKVVVDEACYLAVGADPTAAAGTSWLLGANTPIVVPVSPGDLFSFKDVA